jgi:hypothetical protein
MRRPAGRAVNGGQSYAQDRLTRKYEEIGIEKYEK